MNWNSDACYEPSPVIGAVLTDNSSNSHSFDLSNSDSFDLSNSHSMEVETSLEECSSENVENVEKDAILGTSPMKRLN